MSEHDVQMVVTILGQRISEIRDDIKESRTERRDQIATIHTRLNDHAERIRVIEISQAEMTGKQKAERNGFRSMVQWKNLKIAGPAAVVAVGGLILVAWKWGPSVLSFLGL